MLPPSPSLGASARSPVAYGDDDQRCPNLWFSDCGLVIRADKMLFRVSKDMLAARSPVFADMLSFPQPADVEMIEGCPVVSLPDAAQEVTVFLRAVFDPEFFKPYPSKTDYPTIRGILRLSNKYDVDSLRKRALVHLDSFPTRQTDCCSWNDTRENLFSFINLCREVSALWLLPRAFHMCSDLHPQSIICGSTPPNGTHTVLNQDVQVAVLSGSLILRTEKMSEFFDFIWHPAKIEGCNTPGACLASRNRLRRRVEKTRGMYSPLDFPFDLLLERMSACQVCQKALRKGHKHAIRQLEDSLPEIFCLPSWSELVAMKASALG
ncbi:hypothetical protein GGX14DRAFT_351947 [Mycena pura]|uniref:BTB domain-containing protein n=1 Tax=Mycena pura TaxID=153505 RepID=A0AAD7E263_9AGAR|nr:hypothetical protein GGX14DRAFT_351947 [Mycena pura]